jgi:hypothetical protein
LPPRPDERSSLDVLLRHRAELNLTAAQVERLEGLDGRLERETAGARDALAALRASRARKPAAGGFGMGRGGGDLSGGGRHGGGGGARPAAGPSPAEQRDALLEQLDDADTRAFFEAHDQVLTAAQRPAAEQLASAWRAALVDFREALRARGGAEDSP